MCENSNSDWQELYNLLDRAKDTEHAERVIIYWNQYLDEEEAMYRRTRNVVTNPTHDMLKAFRGFIDQLDQKIIDSIKEAIHHSQDVFDRKLLTSLALNDSRLQAQVESQKARIGFFVNALRRYLSPFVQEMRRAGGDDEWYRLCDFLSKIVKTEMWDDIAKPRDTWGWHHEYKRHNWTFSFARMKELIAVASNSTTTPVSRVYTTTVPAYKDPLIETTDQIGNDLAKLEKEMYPLFSGVNETKRINEEADKVIGGLCALAETLPQEQE